MALRSRAGCFAAADERPEVKEDGELTPEKGEDSDTTEKHKLEHAWTLWFDNPTQGPKQSSQWGQTLRAVYTFRTVEDFWWYVLRFPRALLLQVLDRVVPNFAELPL